MLITFIILIAVVSVVFIMLFFKRHKNSKEDQLVVEVFEVGDTNIVSNMPIKVPTVKPSDVLSSTAKVSTNKSEFILEELILSPDQVDGNGHDLIEHCDRYDSTLDLDCYKYPSLHLLDLVGSHDIASLELELKKTQMISILNSFNIEIDYISVTFGPTVVFYEIAPAPGVRIAKIKALEKDIGFSLGSMTTRVIGHIPGTYAIGIEVSRVDPEIVRINSVLASEKFQLTLMDLPIVLGKTMDDRVFLVDLTKLPHLLIAGATGQGKSVTLNAIIISLLYKKHPSQLKFVLIDVNELEFAIYNKIKDHFLTTAGEGIVSSVPKVIQTLDSLCLELEARYTLFNSARVNNLQDYNERFINRELNRNTSHRFLPFIVVIIDEFSGFISKSDATVELLIARLTQLGRAVGIHLVISTQRPTVDVITGSIKAGFSSRIAFRVASSTDSKTILDTIGAENLKGQGDMLYTDGTDLIHLQGVFVGTEEAQRVSSFIGNQQGYSRPFMLPDSNLYRGGSRINFYELDNLFEDAARLIVMHQQASNSLIQRKFKFGYNRAGRIMDELEETGVIGPFNGSRVREVLIRDSFSLEKFLEVLKNGNRS